MAALCSTQLTFGAEREKKIVFFKGEKTGAEAQAPGLSVSRCPHLGNTITYEEMRDKEPRLIVEAVHCLAV